MENLIKGNFLPLQVSSKEERIEQVLLSGREGWSYRKIANEFNAHNRILKKRYFGKNKRKNTSF